MLKTIKSSLSKLRNGQKKLHWVRRIKTTRPNRQLAWKGAKVLSIASIVFVLGLGIGLGVGVWIDLNEDHTPIKSVKLDKASIEDESGGYVLPVQVLKSQKALKNFAYEEDLPQETIDLSINESLKKTPKKIEAKPNVTIPTSTPKPVQAPERAASAPVIMVEIEDVSPEIPDQLEAIELAAIPDMSINGIYPETIPLWQRRAVSVDLSADKPMIAIVIDDVGIHQKHSQAAIALPGPLTLSFIPYGYNLQDLVNQTRANGHEVMLHLPMEPINPSVDPGPNALLASLDEAELLRRIEWGFSQFGDYVGVNNHMGSRFTAWEPGMRLVMREIQKRNLLFMDSVTTRQTVGFEIAQEMGVPNAIRDIFLDHVIDKNAIAKQLKRVEKTAIEQGYAIAIGHPHDETVDSLKSWLIDVQSRGFTLVPVTAIVKKILANKLAESG